MKVVYEDNHLLIACKNPGEIVQGDRTGDEPMGEVLKRYLKLKYNKPGNVFLGLTHRLDRPVGGLVVFARTGKALSRMNNMFRNGEVRKTYLAIVGNKPPYEHGVLEAFLLKNESQNKSYVVYSNKAGAKKAILEYRTVAISNRYYLLEVELKTGRHHQIRCQLANMGCPIKGDLKYGAKRSNPDGSICLLSYRVRFVHPVSKIMIDVRAPLPEGEPWNTFKNLDLNL